MSGNKLLTNWLGPSILLISAISWYYASSGFLQELLSKVLSSNESLYIRSITYISAIFFILLGAVFSSKFHSRLRFLFIWVVSGVIVSLIPLIGVSDATSAVVITFLFIATWSFGVPASMAYFAESTSIENRARIGGLILSFSLILGALSKFLLANKQLVINSLYLVFLRAFSFTCFLFKQPHPNNNDKVRNSYTFSTLIKEKSLILYLIPWTLFILINELFAPIASTIQSKELVSLTTLLSTILAGVFSVVGGFFADIFGRKPTTIIGFILLGLGYAFLGIFPLSLLSWYFYTVVDGVAWGMLFAIFLITLWGDLAAEKSSDKYYAIGLMPLIISKLLSLTMSQGIVSVISVNAIFSFAAFFLFLAVFPLMYASETLPEKVIKRRELRKYVEKAKRIREKYQK